MTNEAPSAAHSTVPLTGDGFYAPGAVAILRGVQRLLRARNFESLAEVPLGNGRRADVLGIGPAGEAWIIEIKSSIADFRADHKWRDYRDYCDGLFFAVAPDFPIEILPYDAGLILADAYSGDVIRMASAHTLAPARRKTLVLQFARIAAMRLTARIDPAGQLIGSSE